MLHGLVLCISMRIGWQPVIPHVLPQAGAPLPGRSASAHPTIFSSTTDANLSQRQPLQPSSRSWTGSAGVGDLDCRCFVCQACQPCRRNADPAAAICAAPGCLHANTADRQQASTGCSQAPPLALPCVRCVAPALPKQEGVWPLPCRLLEALEGAAGHL